jgi:hypothetical protein
MTAQPAGTISEAGRVCPGDYRYPPSVFRRPAEITAEVLYVAGGVYGNLAALDAIEELAAAEPVPPTIVFNGDFHWFDAEPVWFAEVARRVAQHRAIRGNVETEIARSRDVGAGCGCAYPPSIPDDVVRRSNDILRELREAASTVLGTAAGLAGLEMHCVARVGDLTVGILHGDATSLAGWGFAHDALDQPAVGRLDDIRRQSAVDMFASTHTCLAALRDLTLPGGRLTIINNGAAGMPNFAGGRFGIVSRIATRPSPTPPLYGVRRGHVHIDALALPYDHGAFVDRFLARWPEGSAAHASYFRRIDCGPDYRLDSAWRRAA